MHDTWWIVSDTIFEGSAVICSFGLKRDRQESWRQIGQLLHIHISHELLVKFISVLVGVNQF